MVVGYGLGHSTFLAMAVEHHEDLSCAFCGSFSARKVMAENQHEGVGSPICENCVNALDAWFINHPAELPRVCAECKRPEAECPDFGSDVVPVRLARLKNEDGYICLDCIMASCDPKVPE